MSTQYNRYNSEALFKKNLVAENISRSTIKNYLSDLRHYFGWLQHNEAINSTEDIDVMYLSTVPAVNSYVLYLKTNNIPEKTINRRLSTLRKFFSFAHGQGWISHNPAKKIDNLHSEINPSSTIEEFEIFLKSVGIKENELKDRIDDVNEFLNYKFSFNHEK